MKSPEKLAWYIPISQSNFMTDSTSTQLVLKPTYDNLWLVKAAIGDSYQNEPLAAQDIPTMNAEFRSQRAYRHRTWIEAFNVSAIQQLYTFTSPEQKRYNPLSITSTQSHCTMPMSWMWMQKFLSLRIVKSPKDACWIIFSMQHVTAIWHFCPVSMHHYIQYDFCT